MSSLRTSAVVATVLLAGGICSAQDIWAVDNQGPPAAGTVGDRLIRVDRNDPSQVTVVGDIGVAGIVMTGLDFMPNQSLWAAGTDFDGFSAIYPLDTITGAATGSIPISGFMNPANENISDLAYNPATGEMWGVTIDNSGQVRQSNIYSINLMSGAAALIAENVMSNIEILDLGMAIDSAGDVYLEDVSSDVIWWYDSTVTNVLGSQPLGFNANFSQGMGIDWSRDNKGFVGAYTFDQPPGSENLLYSFDFWLANYGLVGVIGDGVPNGSTGLAEWETGDVAIMPIPAPGVAIVLGLAGGWATARRRR